MECYVELGVCGDVSVVARGCWVDRLRGNDERLSGFDRCLMSFFVGGGCRGDPEERVWRLQR